MIPDYHIHTALCKHASGTINDYVQQALKRGLTEIAFTDHIPLPDQFDSAHRMFPAQIDAYLSEIKLLQKRHPEIKIRTGIEADYYSGFESYLEEFLLKYPFDLVIMSVHFIKNWPDGNWAFSYDFPQKTLTEIYSEYLDAVVAGIDTGLFDIVGHLDLIKSSQQSLLQHNKKQVLQILDRAQAQNMAIELNTSGLRKEIGQTYPDLSFLPHIVKSGLPLTLGSDAHKPEQVGLYFEEITRLLSAFNGLKLARFSSRKRHTSLLTEAEI